MDGLGEQDALVLDFVDIFACVIDFHSDPQPGDRLQIVVEKYYTGKTFVKYGRILYASYQSGTKIFQAIDFQGSGNSGKQRAYYTAKGESLQRAFLRSPLQFTRISSGYTKARRHPILGGLRPHYGVDYAAPAGNPVWAIAEGTIASCGWNGGYGKQVIIKHAGGYQSQYGHLSRVAAGIKKGQKVRQKQVIGYVGSTGLSTGPHLDFRLLRNNVFRNPLREFSPPAAPLRKDQGEEFQERKNHLLLWMNDPSNATYHHAAFLTSEDLGKTANRQ
jgi:murein DD-endopeptidase MepM/ murein hydrolase activator NlpD